MHGDSMIKADSDGYGLAPPVLFKGLLSGVPISLSNWGLTSGLQIRATVKGADRSFLEVQR